jgi:hypothetical protein
MDPNENHVQNITIQIKDSVCHFIMNNGNDVFNLNFGLGNWRTSQTNKPGPSALSSAKENFALLSPYKVAGNFYWKDDQTLVLEMRYLESPHSETTTCHFEGGKVTIETEFSFHFGARKLTITGTQK